MKKLAKIIISAVVSVILIAEMLGLFFGPKAEFSENQNKALSDFPELSFENIISHKFSEEYEDFVSDHLPLKEKLISVRTAVQKAFGYKMIGGAYISGDRCFLEVKEPDPSDFITSTNRLFENIENESVTKSILMIPTASTVYSEQMPSYAPAIDQNAFINESLLPFSDADLFINLYEPLVAAKEDGNVFYRLDHHWTAHGAFAAYRAFCAARGLSSPELSDYSIETVSSDFYGTLHSKTLDPFCAADTIEKYTKKGVSFDTFFGRSGEKRSYYNSEWLCKKDKYAYFGDGNPDLVVLINENAESENELVIVKDSFANSFAPFLSEKYRKVHMIDARYFRGAVSAYVNENPSVSDLVVMYNVNALNDNTGIARLK